MSLFRHRNRRSGQDNYRMAGARASALTGNSGRGLIARSRGVDGAASYEEKFNAARQGTLMQHQLRQSDAQHELSMDRGFQDLTQNADMHPHRVTGASLQNRGAEQAINQSAAMHPYQIKGASLQNRGAEQTIGHNAAMSPHLVTGAGLQNKSVQQAIDHRDESHMTEQTQAGLRNRMLAMQHNDLAAEAPIRGSLRNVNAAVAGDKEILATAQQIQPQANGAFLVTRPDGTQVELSPERAAASGYPVSAPDNSQSVQVGGLAQQIADTIAAQGGDMPSAMAAMQVPPELYQQTQAKAMELLAGMEQQAGKDKGSAWQRRWPVLGGDKDKRAADDRQASIRGSLRQSGTSPDNIRQQQAAAQKPMKDAQHIMSNPNNPQAQQLYKLLQQSAATDPAAQKALEELNRLGFRAK